MISRLFLLLTAIFVIASQSLLAQKLTNIRTVAETRYDMLEYGDAYYRVQAAFRNWMTIDLGKGFTVKSHISSGERFQSRWSTATDFKKPAETRFMTLNIRQLYLEYEFNSSRLQIGTIPPVKNVATSTSLEATGWIDGLRYVHKTANNWEFELVAGGLADLNQPNMFVRPKKLNFIEFETNMSFSEQWFVDVKAEILDKSPYLATELRFKPNAKSPQLSAEYMRNLDNGSNSINVGAIYDMNQLYSDRENSGLRTFIMFSRIDENIGLRGMLSDDFYDLGTSLIIELEGPLKRDIHLSWFARQVFMEQSRTTAGIRVDLRSNR
jgi:hypothetical protein